MSYSPLRTLGRALRMMPVLIRSGPAGSFTAADLLEARARRRPNAPFVRFEGREVSYGALNAQANRIAHWALANGIGHRTGRKTEALEQAGASGCGVDHDGRILE